jgi:hypothetical protein
LRCNGGTSVTQNRSKTARCYVKLTTGQKGTGNYHTATMTNKFLKSLIDRLNRNQSQALFNLRPLTDNVVFAKVWNAKPKPTDKISHPNGPYLFYFIKNEIGFYVAVVLDMRHDLHWFVLPKYRQNGYLTKAMKEVILFHIFQDRDEQRITIDEFQIGSKNFKASESVAKKLGFVKSDEESDSDYILTIDKYRTENYIDGQNTEISKERIEELKKQVNYLARSLWFIQTEIEMKLGDLDYAEEIKELVDEIKSHTFKLEDVWWESKKALNKE